MSQDAESAIEVTDVTSAAQEIERRMTAAEEPAQEIEQGEVEEQTDINASEDDEGKELESETEGEEETKLEQESEDQEPEAEEGEALHYENVAELAEATGLSLDDFMENIKVTRKIDGVEEEVTLAELRNGNQRDADYRRKTTELADNRKAFEGELEQAKASLGQQLQEVAAMTTNLEQQLMGEFQAVDWNALELSDREEWLVQRQKFGERQQQIEAVKSQTQQQLTQQKQELQAKQQEAQNQFLSEQNDLLLSTIPEYADTAFRETSSKEMTAFLGDYGFSAAEVGNVIDHRLVKLAFDAMKNKGKTGKIDIVKKKVKRLPKIVKPGATVDKAVIQKKQQSDKLTRFKKQGKHSNKDVADLLLDRM